MTSTTLPPDVADLLRAISAALASQDDYRERALTGSFIVGVLGVVLDGPVDPTNAAKAIRSEYPAPSTVCDTCHSEPVTVLDGVRRLCSTCALRVCDVCQVRRATVMRGESSGGAGPVLEVELNGLCPLCAEREGAEVAVTP